MKRLICLIAAAAAALMLTGCGQGSGAGKPEGTVELSVTQNAIEGGKNSESAVWMKEWVIPKFTEAQKKKGVDVKVEFVGSGIDDEPYKQKQALDLKAGSAPDIIDLDGIWIGEFAQAGYIKPLNEVAGDAVDQWDGWRQIPESVQGLGTFEDKQYATPVGTDGRVLFFNKKLFKQAGLPEDWQPTSWQEILDAGNKLKDAGVPTPIQINAGAPMGEATTMQGFLPLLAGAGAEVEGDGKWVGGGAQAMKDVLDFYRQIYKTGLGDPKLQQEAKGRDKSFEQFADGKIGILAEGDYFWRDVVSPKGEVAPMKDRDEVVGYAKIPAKEPGAGINDQDFVSMSGGSARVINPGTEHPQQTWELLAFMHSAEAVKAETEGRARITPRKDVNDEILTDDPMLRFISDEVLPITAYRPPVAVYNEVSVLLQEATGAVTSGKSVAEAGGAYQQKLEELVGGAENTVNQ